MTGLWSRMDYLCIIGLLFAAICSVSAHPDYYWYHPDHADSYYINSFPDFRELPHNIFRREVLSSNNTQPTTTTTTSTTYTTTTTKPPQSSTTPPSFNKAIQAMKPLAVNKTESVPQKPIVLPSEKTLTNSTASSVLSGETGPRRDQEDTRVNATTVPDELDTYPTDEVLKETLEKNNITVTKYDNHIYYNSAFNHDPDVGKALWVDMTNRSDVKMHELLANSHRKAATVKLSFTFPFYGHRIENVTIATGGFLYTGDYMHTWLAATQYIAPLMGNFHTSLMNESTIKYVDNGTAFTVQWERVMLRDKPEFGKFTFQVTLLNNGDVIFVYKEIPITIKLIKDDKHPVKVGLSDAYLMDHTVFFVRRKTIYEYHRIAFSKDDITNWTSIYLTAQPTCVRETNCTSCLNKENIALECRWCPSERRCSNGIDRRRQDWLVQFCDKHSVGTADECNGIPENGLTRDSLDDEFKNSLEDGAHADKVAYSRSSAADGKVPSDVSEIVAMIFIIAMIMGLGIWVFYAYRNPHTTSGQMLIRYRPSQWRWRRGEPRYTVATIHM